MRGWSWRGRSTTLPPFPHAESANPIVLGYVGARPAGRPDPVNLNNIPTIAGEPASIPCSDQPHQLSPSSQDRSQDRRRQHWPRQGIHTMILLRAGVDTYVALAFAKDNGGANFGYYDGLPYTPAQVAAAKQSNPNLKFMASLGGAPGPKMEPLHFATLKQLSAALRAPPGPARCGVVSASRRLLQGGPFPGTASRAPPAPPRRPWARSSTRGAWWASTSTTSSSARPQRPTLARGGARSSKRCATSSRPSSSRCAPSLVRAARARLATSSLAAAWQRPTAGAGGTRGGLVRARHHARLIHGICAHACRRRQLLRGGLRRLPISDLLGQLPGGLS